MPKGKGAPLSEAQKAALAAGRVAAKEALAKANEKRKEAAKSKKDIGEIKKPAEITQKKPPRDAIDVSLKELHEAARRVAEELGPEHKDTDDWAHITTASWWRDQTGVPLVMNAFLAKARVCGEIEVAGGSVNNFPVRMIDRMAKILGVKLERSIGYRAGDPRGLKLDIDLPFGAPPLDNAD